MIPFTGQKHGHSDTNNVDGETKRRRVDTSKKYGCVCTSCHRKNLMRCDCVIFLKKNYDIDNSNIADALSRRYREVGNKEFICKPCHTKLQHSHFSTLNSNGVDHIKNMVVMNSNDTNTINGIPHDITWFHTESNIHKSLYMYMLPQTWFTKLSMHHIQGIKIQFWQ